MKSKRYHTSALHPTKQRPSQLAERWEYDEEEHAEDELLARRRRRSDRELRRQDWREDNPGRKGRRAA
jgi:hypothetical protein